MTASCDSVAERVALGESLGELAEHVMTCTRCQRVVEISTKLGATRREVDPGMGFSARMTAGAQRRIVVRQRRRVATGLAATVAAGMLGVFVLTRDPSSTPSESPSVKVPTVAEEDTQPLDDSELEGLVQMADTKRSRRLSAHWARIQRPLEPYMHLVSHVDEHDKGETP